jgi:hypothetical protein
MKDLGPMHYFLGLEVWKSPEDIFLNQGKHVVEILNRFDMMDFKSMSTPMEMNLKLLANNSSEIVDQTRYMLFCEHLELLSGGAQTCSPCSSKACDEIP